MSESEESNDLMMVSVRIAEIAKALRSIENHEFYLSDALRCQQRGMIQLGRGYVVKIARTLRKLLAMVSNQPKSQGDALVQRIHDLNRLITQRDNELFTAKALQQQLADLVAVWRNNALKSDESGPTAMRHCADELAAHLTSGLVLEPQK